MENNQWRVLVYALAKTNNHDDLADVSCGGVQFTSKHGSNHWKSWAWSRY